MLFTVTTVKDRLENIQRFVAGNLAGGVDHMVVFLEDSSPEVEEFLRAHPHVTCWTEADWWGRFRPQLLNRRQNLNSNAVRSVLKQAGLNDWLFHIDGDEILRLDRRALDALPAKVRAVRAAPLEAVGVADATAMPHEFKRLLDENELSLLTTLGALTEPSNSAYFRSHIAGKVGVRGQADLHLRIHSVVDDTGTRRAAHQGPEFNVLHFESWSGAEFVRKWEAMVGSGPSINFGEDRLVIAKGLRALLQADIDPGARSHLLADIYQRHMADPVDTLRMLDFLVTSDPANGPHTPAADASAVAAVREGLKGLKGTKRGHLAPPSVPVKNREADGERDRAHAAGEAPQAPAGGMGGKARRLVGRLRSND